MNSGKIFEALIQESCKLQNIECYRLRDAGSYVNGKQTGIGRAFTTKNICDFIIFDGKTLVYAEAKSTKVKSIAFKRLTQQSALLKKQSETYLKNIKCGYLLEFSDEKKYFWVSCMIIKYLEMKVKKKSFNITDLEALECVRRIETYLPPRKRKIRLNMTFLERI